MGQVRGECEAHADVILSSRLSVKEAKTPEEYVIIYDWIGFYIFTNVRITVIMYRIVPRHPILQRTFFLIFPKAEPGQLQNNYVTAWKITSDII